MTQRSVLILAAGRGERMHSERPKALQPLGGIPLLSHSLKTAHALSPKRLAVLVGHRADEVRGAFHGEKGVRWVLQRPQKGTAHAVLTALPSFKGSRAAIFIIQVDVPLVTLSSLKSLWEAFEREQPAMALLTAHFEDPTGYGRIVRDSTGRIVRIIEERDATREEKKITEGNPGIYLVRPDSLLEPLKKVKKNPLKGEYYFTDVIAPLIEAGEKVVSVTTNSPDEVMGINSKAELARAERILRRRIVDHWLEAGVTVIDPETTWIGPEVTLEPDVVIHPGCVLSGPTKVERGAELLPYSVIEGSTIEEDARIGPFAHLRPGAVIRSQAHVGNFVEIKKSVLGKGAKANHLAYLGDAEIGAGANIGAGTITCNYDGQAKHKTVIGEGAFIGSDTQLVAPVRVGRGAVVGAGTTVTSDVPPKSLAISRVPQQNIANWRRRK